MPLSQKGKTILTHMRKTYGSDKKAKKVLYASVNKGKIRGAERADRTRTVLNPY